MQKFILTDKRGTSKVMELLLIEFYLEKPLLANFETTIGYYSELKKYESALLQSIQEGVPVKDAYFVRQLILIDSTIQEIRDGLKNDTLYEVPKGYKAEIKEKVDCTDNSCKGDCSICTHLAKIKYAILNPITKEETPCPNCKETIDQCACLRNKCIRCGDDERLTTKEEMYYAIKEAIQVMEHYDTGEDFALVSSLRRLRDIDKAIEALNKLKLT